MKAMKTWRLKEERWVWWCLVDEDSGGGGGGWVVGKSREMRLGLTRGSQKNEGTRSVRRVERCFKWQDWGHKIIGVLMIMVVFFKFSSMVGSHCKEDENGGKNGRRLNGLFVLHTWANVNHNSVGLSEIDEVFSSSSSIDSMPKQNVHHAGQPMPGEEQEDIVVTRTQCNLLNTTCPLSGKPVTALSDPVRSMDCKHIYDKMVIMQYIRSRKGRARCPITGCPKILEEDRVVCDPLLRIEIDEMQAMSKQTATHDNIEDFTDQLNEEDEEFG